MHYVRYKVVHLETNCFFHSCSYSFQMRFCQKSTRPFNSMAMPTIVSISTPKIIIAHGVTVPF